MRAGLDSVLLPGETLTTFAARCDASLAEYERAGNSVSSDVVLSTLEAKVAAPLPPHAKLLLQFMRAARWNINAVSHQMGVARMTIYRRMKRWGIRDLHG